MPIDAKPLLPWGLLLGLAVGISGCGGSGNSSGIADAPPPTAPPGPVSTIRFAPSPQNVSSPIAPAVVVDGNGDGWLETVGTLNDGAGNLLPVSPSSMGLDGLLVDGRPDDLRVADFNGDGSPDLIAQGYSSTDVDTRALLYFNDGSGHFQEDPASPTSIFAGAVRVWSSPTSTTTAMWTSSFPITILNRAPTRSAPTRPRPICCSTMGPDIFAR
ncbi:MAG TPA: VCBS repeat-containing protein [Terriglobales bacterium]|nr:VCBS repeat-containing protein [Terriglobales bacterium]